MLQVGRVEYDTHCRCRWHPRVIEFITDHPGYENQECILEFIYMGIQFEWGKVSEGVLPKVLLSFLELKDLLTKDTTRYTQVSDFSFFYLKIL